MASWAEATPPLMVPGRRRILLTLAGMVCAAAPAWAADQVARLIETLAAADSFKVRIQAAAVLARMKDPRVAGALGRAATSDRHEAVRVFVVRLLASNPGGDATDERARVALKKASTDKEAEVRREAQRSLAQLDQARARHAEPPRRGAAMAVAVRSTADRTGRVPELKDRLRQEIESNLRREARVTVAGANDPTLAYVIDGTIARFEHGPRGADIESLCAVQLVVSRPSRGIVMVASGEAAVQRPRMQFRPALRPSMDGEALHYAAKSAHDNLARFLAMQ